MVGKSPANFIDLTGMKFGKLTVLERAENAEKWATRWVCQCDCHGPNSIVIVRGHDLRSGNTKSCGCLHDGHPIHGESHTKCHDTWNTMMQRCYNSNCKSYQNYGARGITVCDDWHDYQNFKIWFNETLTDSNLTLDRIDNDGGYEPDNCRWATRKEQQNNRRCNVIYSMNGEAHTLSEWCDIVGLPYKTVISRINDRGWTFEQAITTPIRTHSKR